MITKDFGDHYLLGNFKVYPGIFQNDLYLLSIFVTLSITYYLGRIAIYDLICCFIYVKKSHLLNTLYDNYGYFLHFLASIILCLRIQLLFVGIS